MVIHRLFVFLHNLQYHSVRAGDKAYQLVNKHYGYSIEAYCKCSIGRSQKKIEV